MSLLKARLSVLVRPDKRFVARRHLWFLFDAVMIGLGIHYFLRADWVWGVVNLSIGVLGLVVDAGKGSGHDDSTDSSSGS